MARVSCLLLVLFLASAYAHTYLSSVTIDGTAYDAGDCVRQHPIGTANFPISTVYDADMTCGWLPLAAQPANRKCPIAPGSRVALHWAYAYPALPNDLHLARDHKGPAMAYMARSETGAGNVWFKVFEEGLNNGQWGTDTVIDNNGKLEFTVPSDIAPGNYLIRGEVIALHASQNVNGAQPYVGCVEVTVSGSGTAYPDGVAFPGAYQNTDPGIYLNIYNGLSSYVIPGPRVYVAGTATNPPPADSSSSSSTTGTAPAPTTAPSTSDGVVVYSDSLSPIFADYSWATEKNPADTSQKYSGANSYSFVPKDWQAIYLYCQACIDSAKFDSIEFWVNGGATGGQNVHFNLLKGSGLVQPDLSIASYIGSDIPANQWVKATVKLSSFAEGTYDGLWFQDHSIYGPQGTLYIDEIVLVPRTSSSKDNGQVDHVDNAGTHSTADKEVSDSGNTWSKLIVSNIVTFVGTLVVVGVVVASVYIYKSRKSSSEYQYKEFVENGRL